MHTRYLLVLKHEFFNITSSETCGSLPAYLALDNLIEANTSCERILDTYFDAFPRRITLREGFCRSRGTLGLLGSVRIE